MPNVGRLCLNRSNRLNRSGRRRRRLLADRGRIDGRDCRRDWPPYRKVSGSETVRRLPRTRVTGRVNRQDCGSADGNQVPAHERAATGRGVISRAAGGFLVFHRRCQSVDLISFPQPLTQDTSRSLARELTGTGIPHGRANLRRQAISRTCAAASSQAPRARAAAEGRPPCA